MRPDSGLIVACILKQVRRVFAMDFENMALLSELYGTRKYVNSALGYLYPIENLVKMTRVVDC